MLGTELFMNVWSAEPLLQLVALPLPLACCRPCLSIFLDATKYHAGDSLLLELAGLGCACATKSSQTGFLLGLLSRLRLFYCCKFLTKSDFKLRNADFPFGSIHASENAEV